MKFSTLMVLCGFMFTQQVFAQSNAKNTADCYTQNSNTKGCSTTNNNANQQVQKNTVKTQQKVDNASKAAVQNSQKAEQSSKSAVKTPQKSVKKSQKTVTTPQKTQQKVVVKTLPAGSNLVLETQQQLNRLGYNSGISDGLMGKNTREAIKLFQKRHNMNVDGKSTSALLKKLKNTTH